MECSGNGVCRAKICYCAPNFIGKSCETNQLEVKEEGTPLSKVIKYIKIATVFGFIIGFIVVRHFLIMNK